MPSKGLVLLILGALFITTAFLRFYFEKKEWREKKASIFNPSTEILKESCGDALVIELFFFIFVGILL